MNKQKTVSLILISLCLIANNIAFSAETNKAKTPATSSKQLKGTVVDYRTEYINADWWDKFQDPVLKEYVMKAINTNYDLKIASLRVLQSQEMVKESLGKEFPLLGLGTDFTRRKTSDNIAMGSISLPSYTQNTYTLPFNASYELDLWLKNRDKTVQKGKEFEAVKYDEKASYISMMSAVASAYFNVINLDKQIQLQKDIINLRKSIFDMTRENYNHGLLMASDVVLVEKSLTEAQSALNDISKYQIVFLNQLAVLTGDSVDNISSLKRTSIDDIDLMTDLPESIKSEIVQKRPDILKAEAELQSARINVKLAKKDFLPDINITGQFGFNADSLSKMFKWDSYIASIGGNLAQTIFSGGQRRARLKLKEYQYKEMLENYQKTILQSFQEVNNSLASLKFDDQKNNDNLSRIQSEKENFNIINNRYESGAISYLDTLQYKERLISLEKEQTQSKTDCLIDSLSLYKAVGGKL